ncbi:MAG: hypothetical protein UU40_C0017G0019 [Candidatus Uhrbacteria bacterium GW2011_GWD2_41_121]|uniref:Uncharacterized protein n=1 Tax=Candidatus Uhrbacteria bacterium GW2011_GWC1_41_20 TaxID=1618983 RepID=A0A0G0VDM4_9BACT|nr:MAG: hypothetical protein UT52_C0017G0005 [Candidatus Uhrbacteria bacterium GW2011_GWE1_39_46]KKR63491.1 MAG: hypothetical protein UU04_C0017G0019 [Candidatus Uhrbacteria bacterium GW2011_GWC2_40_450]KKR89705.1 MAG: hypothetical protein UU40_C0017G0019 [Candidatus Uhrbacteria bacterium GW2011_GWD2_41_121]KKR95861.1 MAG: hypothetical protein UU46_C0012G0014 [Candidatus Uhrbacteria bacterium GW2011_GWD1_41_16]KKR98994.1 MAG: hypothetical protein UU50_C0012G0042 [Candidatus Uhrbacteria bacteriu
MITNVYLVVCPRQTTQRKVPAFDLVRSIPTNITRLCFPPNPAGLHCASTIAELRGRQIRTIICDARMSSPSDEPSAKGFSKLDRYATYVERSRQTGKETLSLISYLRQHYPRWYEKIQAQKREDLMSILAKERVNVLNAVLVCQNPLSELFAFLLCKVAIQRPRAWQVMRLHRDGHSGLFILQNAGMTPSKP